MATRKMTFSIPEGLASQFVRSVPARSRSRYLAEALTQKLSERDRQLIRSCEAANEATEVEEIEKEFDAIAGEGLEAGPRAPARRRLVGATRSHARRRN
jgi:hypothetical protein